MRTADQLIGAFVAILSVLCLMEAHRVWNGWGGTGSMPLIVGVVFMLLSIAFFISHPRVRLEGVSRKEVLGVFFIGGSFALYILFMNWLGFFVSTWLLLAMVGLYISRGRVFTTIVWTGAVSGLSHFIFKNLLGMYLPTGFIGG